MPDSTPTRAFHAMAKPSGPGCNLRCAYCFYLEKKNLYRDETSWRMDDGTLHAYVRDYIASIGGEDEVAFTWQGGEPTLLGLNFYRRAVALQERYGKGRRITNSFQTNGTLLDESWCDFLKEHDFLVGLSLDGPDDIHDRYRVRADGGPTHAAVMRALRLLRLFGVRFNVLACVNRHSSREPLRVYEFLRQAGASHMQFLPVVERLPDARDAEAGLRLRSPAASPSDRPGEFGETTPWSVLPEDYGRFLTDIFDVWIRRDVGDTFVMNFEWALANFLGQPGAVCHHRPTCGRSVVVEHNGDVYACDHYVYDVRRLGNIQRDSFAAMLDSPEQEKFGTDKFNALPGQCRTCRVLRGCWGGCPKHRFLPDASGEPGLNYLCAGHYRFFNHVAPYLKAIADLLAAGRPASDIVGATFVSQKGNGGNSA